MLLKTKHFGEINIDESKLLNLKTEYPGLKT